MTRTDYLYIVEAGATRYAGQATTPARALNHWFGTHNATLNEAVRTTVNEGRWPRLLILPLPEPNLEDLANAERLLIEVLLWDEGLRSATCNKSTGNDLFAPVQVDASPASDGPNGQVLRLAWAHGAVEGDPGSRTAYRLLSVDYLGMGPERQLPDDATWVEVSQPFISAANALAVAAGLEQLNSVGDSLAAPWTSFFNHVRDFLPGVTELPYRAKQTFQQLAGTLGAPFVLVNLTRDRLDDRGAIGVGLTEPVIRARASRWWDKGSRSYSRTSGRTLQGAMAAPKSIRPKFVVATTSGAKGKRVVLAAWPLRDRSFTVEDGKLVFELEPPNLQSPLTQRAARIIGTHLVDPYAEFGGRGALWVDVPAQASTTAGSDTGND
ncbi:hypothetical protein JOD57_000038 [Geodermatophilus bullaregiensis]|uniref:hypothetical protein n=1 Tax=Geodermatophilus bullaregiensis TaxID=1564160 RepID=UPI00195799FD|nr:hypothetical protein [Geodermatophilus bullaregiensis]MBM7804201.1 hypothetical protein [Geodermatophilus bullaregiensis]